VSRLGPALERALLKELRVWCAHTNRLLFEGKLKPATLMLTDASRQLGRWERATRTIALSRQLVSERPWGEVVEVLKHEMAHQYCDEVLGEVEEGPHGATFRAVCAERGIDGSATGTVPSGDAGSASRARVVARIQKLLALADSPEVHESEAAMRAARRMLLQHNLSVAETQVEARYGWQQLGAPTGRVPAHHRLLAGILGQHFFVSCVWVHGFDARKGRRGRILEVSGTAENLNIAAWVHGYLLETGERLWVAHRRERRLGKDTGRRGFLQGVMVGFNEKLHDEARVCAEEGLVWKGDAGLSDYVGRRHQHLRAGRRTEMRATDAWHDGRAAGREIVLRKPVQSDPSRRARQLSDGRRQ
jgi:hypothetical protein